MDVRDPSAAAAAADVGGGGGGGGGFDLVSLNFDATADLQDAVCDAEAGMGADAPTLLARLKEAVCLLQEREGEVLRVAVHGNELAAALAVAREEVAHLRSTSLHRHPQPSSPQPTQDAPAKEIASLVAALQDKDASLAAAAARAESREASITAWSQKLQTLLREVEGARRGMVPTAAAGVHETASGDLTAGIERLVDAWSAERRAAVAAARNTRMQEAAHQRVVASYEAMLSDAGSTLLLARGDTAGGAAQARGRGSAVPTSKTTGTNTTDLRAATASSGTNTDVDVDADAAGAATPRGHKPTPAVLHAATSPGAPGVPASPLRSGDATATIETMKTNLKALEDRLASFALRSPGSPASSTKKKEGGGEGRTPGDPTPGSAVASQARVQAAADAQHAAALRDELDALRDDLELGRDESALRAAEAEFLRAHIGTLHEAIAALVHDVGDGAPTPASLVRHVHTLQLLSGPIGGTPNDEGTAATTTPSVPVQRETSRVRDARPRAPSSARGGGCTPRSQAGTGIPCSKQASLGSLLLSEEHSDADVSDLSVSCGSSRPLQVTPDMARTATVPAPADDILLGMATRAVSLETTTSAPAFGGAGARTVPCSYDVLPDADPGVRAAARGMGVGAADVRRLLATSRSPVDDRCCGGAADAATRAVFDTSDPMMLPLQPQGTHRHMDPTAAAPGVDEVEDEDSEAFPAQTSSHSGFLSADAPLGPAHVWGVGDGAAADSTDALLCELVQAEQRVRGDLLKATLRAWEVQQHLEAHGLEGGGGSGYTFRALPQVPSAAALKEHLAGMVAGWLHDEDAGHLRRSVRTHLARGHPATADALAAQNRALLLQWEGLVDSFTAAAPPRRRASHPARSAAWGAPWAATAVVPATLGLRRASSVRKRSRSAPSHLRVVTTATTSPEAVASRQESRSGGTGSLDSPVAGISKQHTKASCMSTTTDNSEWGLGQRAQRGRQLHLDSLLPPNSGLFSLGGSGGNDGVQGNTQEALMSVDIFDVSNTSKNRSRSAPSKRHRESIVTVQTCSSVASEALGADARLGAAPLHASILSSSCSSWGLAAKLPSRRSADLDALMPLSRQAGQAFSPSSPKAGGDGSPHTRKAEAQTSDPVTATPSTPEMTLRYPPNLQRMQVTRERERDRLMAQRRARGGRGGGGMLAFQLPPSPKAKRQHPMHVMPGGLATSPSYGTCGVFPMEEEMIEELSIPYAESFVCGALSDVGLSQSARSCSPLTPLIHPSMSPSRMLLQRHGRDPSRPPFSQLSPHTSTLGGGMGGMRMSFQSSIVSASVASDMPLDDAVRERMIAAREIPLMLSTTSLRSAASPPASPKHTMRYIQDTRRRSCDTVGSASPTSMGHSRHASLVDGSPPASPGMGAIDQSRMSTGGKLPAAERPPKPRSPRAGASPTHAHSAQPPLSPATQARLAAARAAQLSPGPSSGMGFSPTSSRGEVRQPVLHTENDALVDDDCLVRGSNAEESTEGDAVVAATPNPNPSPKSFGARRGAGRKPGQIATHSIYSEDDLQVSIDSGADASEREERAAASASDQ